ncbi:MAG: DUF2313 domain-containing protein [Candidatus Lernaella stagnicola]|nr:DUF2313 domain-containing protein [Candidatus Lernaella stagnicola]
MLTDYPIYPAFTDDFADGVADDEWTDGGAGTVEEDGGVCHMAVTGAALAYRSLDWFHATRCEVAVDVSISFALPAGANNIAAGLLFSGADADVQMSWSLARESTGYSLFLYGGAVGLFSEAHDGSDTRLAVRRQSAARVEFGVIEDGEFVVKATVTDWTETYALVSMTLYSTEPSGTAAWADFSYTSDETHVGRINSRLLGQHLANTIRVYGSGFAAGATATLVSPAGDAVCATTVVSSSELTIVTPVQTTPGWRRLEVRPHMAGPLFTLGDLRATGVGYRLLRALLPPQRYTDDTANLFNVFLAALGLELDRLDAAIVALKNEEIHPETTIGLIHRHERQYGLPIATGHTLQERRDLVILMATMKPRLSVPYLEALAQAVKADAEITENAPYAAFGNMIWQYQIYESEPNELDRMAHAAIERMLRGAGPGWARPAVGHAGFIVGASCVGRDFVTKEAG